MPNRGSRAGPNGARITGANDYIRFGLQDQNGKADSSRIHRYLRLSLGDSRGARPDRFTSQSNRLETDSSAAVRPIASPIRLAIDSTRMLRATRTASVGWIESVITSSLSYDAVRRATAPPDSTPWLI